MEITYVTAGDAPWIVIVRIFENGKIDFEPVERPRRIEAKHLVAYDLERFRKLLASSAVQESLRLEHERGDNNGVHESFVGIKTSNFEFKRLRWTLSPETKDFLADVEAMAKGAFPDLHSEYLGD